MQGFDLHLLILSLCTRLISGGLWFGTTDDNTVLVISGYNMCIVNCLYQINKVIIKITPKVAKQSESHADIMILDHSAKFFSN